MLTPVEIQRRVFKSGVNGYDKKEVDVFIQEFYDSYEVLYKEKLDLQDKVKSLTDALSHYKNIEKTLQKAMILAEKTAEETKQAAYESAKQIEEDAILRSQTILSNARVELANVRQNTVRLLQQYDKYKAQFKALAASQIELLDSESFSINLADLDSVNLSDVLTSTLNLTPSTSEDDISFDAETDIDDMIFDNIDQSAE